jgi:hypothetical protein
MSTPEETLRDDPHEQTDEQAVFRHAFEGGPLDLEIARRVHERARRITERVRKEHGMVDVVQLVRDSRP